MKQTVANILLFLMLCLFFIVTHFLSYEMGRGDGRKEIISEFAARVDSLCGDDSTAVTIKSIKIIYNKKK